ncbi:hypothetical protein [Mycolicibacterium phlei]|uniref:Uncharacterized protein n=1 Tax=Mycolicibacterium phlei DSM 43239 = CCUG 21000 TaxID=1226750 RepID=A0A5N5V6F7_MYCPH|nr:hypothetical protein [Mycolicibacterium phlei]EID18156.1 hypothetical protein MPHLEI_01916 [Mycolicibacterium phlei RIVM601174]KAB7757512.1 hypothetical protein MPHL21000_06925 [Mycolicibacterium phlei DSM 43239 = CCUG 21000]KXW67708.1 hypothetical protein MPHL43239_04210 [Mycolicibacterium phlei DSM 43239 = CCUG 21000]KXW76458.1 hypothetical protein JL15_16860 [Mycolicibacterium phlei DSM 43071]MBF4193019.1 hypothetical protein [Mycolicibacterium phlei]
MWCPSVSLTVWTNAWLAGAAAPDDVLDALSLWAPRHSVTAYDSTAAGRTGLPWPDLLDSSTVSLLQTVRSAAGTDRSGPPVALALPVPGDVRGLPAGTQFQRDAMTAGEAVVVSGGPAGAVGLVPDFEYDEIDVDEDFEAEPTGLSWTVYSVPDPAPAVYVDLGEAEYELRSAVRAAANALGALRAGAADFDIDDPRGLVEQIVESTRVHRIPDHAPERARRVLENATQVDAIITVSSGLIPSGLQSSSEIQLANDALRPLPSVVRSARIAAVTAILHSAWR